MAHSLSHKTYTSVSHRTFPGMSPPPQHSLFLLHIQQQDVVEEDIKSFKEKDQDGQPLLADSETSPRVLKPLS